MEDRVIYVIYRLCDNENEDWFMFKDVIYLKIKDF